MLSHPPQRYTLESKWRALPGPSGEPQPGPSGVKRKRKEKQFAELVKTDVDEVLRLMDDPNFDEWGGNSSEVSLDDEDFRPSRGRNYTREG